MTVHRYSTEGNAEDGNHTQQDGHTTGKKKKSSPSSFTLSTYYPA